MRLILAFKYAIQGIRFAAKSEKNFQIHIFAALFVIILSFFLQLDKIEWIFMMISIFGVMALELVNSAMERAVDLSTDKILPLAKQAKDLAAAAVLIYTLMAVLIGFLILGPKIWELLS
ncbi:diacylglycerol kinase family protein [Lederbergia sp. NSJ-179]|uniref:diacylglycerol kinase n=1 Tax=Lederbergia sp. NSJ-179 TaxID=2931402 RepID=UPI001FD25C23|nr:diacylglycerol kinase family protein [Lederbergia sp. NSJ-179]MCJ7841846.1 diacylglycerol kinase family protein [Lederbergia sp. NSJ-179]